MRFSPTGSQRAQKLAFVIAIGISSRARSPLARALAFSRHTHWSHAARIGANRWVARRSNLHDAHTLRTEHFTWSTRPARAPSCCSLPAHDQLMSDSLLFLSSLCCRSELSRIASIFFNYFYQHPSRPSVSVVTFDRHRKTRLLKSKLIRSLLAILT